MKDRIIPIILILTLLSCFISQFTGCSLIGFGIGAKIDASKSDERVISLDVLTTMKKGTPVTVIKKDEEQLQGTLLGFEPRD